MDDEARRAVLAAAVDAAIEQGWRLDAFSDDGFACSMNRGRKRQAVVVDDQGRVAHYSR